MTRNIHIYTCKKNAVVAVVFLIKSRLQCRPRSQDRLQQFFREWKIASVRTKTHENTRSYSRVFYTRYIQQVKQILYLSTTAVCHIAHARYLIPGSGLRCTTRFYISHPPGEVFQAWLLHTQPRGWQTEPYVVGKPTLTDSALALFQVLCCGPADVSSMENRRSGVLYTPPSYKAAWENSRK